MVALREPLRHYTGRTPPVSGAVARHDAARVLRRACDHRKHRPQSTEERFLQDGSSSTERTDAPDTGVFLSAVLALQLASVKFFDSPEWVMFGSAHIDSLRQHDVPPVTLE